MGAGDSQDNIASTALGMGCLVGMCPLQHRARECWDPNPNLNPNPPWPWRRRGALARDKNGGWGALTLLPFLFLGAARESRPPTTPTKATGTKRLSTTEPRAWHGPVCPGREAAVSAGRWVQPWGHQGPTSALGHWIPTRPLQVGLFLPDKAQVLPRRSAFFLHLHLLPLESETIGAQISCRGKQEGHGHKSMGLRGLLVLLLYLGAAGKSSPTRPSQPWHSGRCADGSIPAPWWQSWSRARGSAGTALATPHCCTPSLCVCCGGVMPEPRRGPCGWGAVGSPGSGPAGPH